MPASATETDFEAFQVELWLDWAGGVATRWPGMWRRLGDFETRRFADAIAGIAIETPIFICGLARAGTSILLECLAEHPETAAHCYRDYPGVLAPIFWDQVSARLYKDPGSFKERAHGDGITVSPESPEAMEEMLWMAFHPLCHDPARDNRIAGDTMASGFAAFYRDHIRKVLWLRHGRRYLSKGNYNIARLAALIRLFPDARIIIPVRQPVSHIASLARQHERFVAAETRHPSALRYMQRVGHFEFGLDRRPLNLGDDAVTQEVLRLWREGREIEGWSLYWSAISDFVADSLATDPVLAEATLVVRFEDLCAEPQTTLERIFAHARLPANADPIGRLATRIRTPAYYEIPFTRDEQNTIWRLTEAAGRRFGY